MLSASSVTPGRPRRSIVVADIGGKSNGSRCLRRETRGQRRPYARRHGSQAAHPAAAVVVPAAGASGRATSRPPARSVTAGRPPRSQYVLAHARPGDIDDVIATIDRFAYEKSFLINVGDEKGALLDAAVQRADPELALELGTYCGYSALRIARAAPRRHGRLGRTVGGQRRQRAPDLGARRRRPTGCTAWSAPSATAVRPWTRWPTTHGLRPGCARFRLPRPRQERLPRRPAEHRRPRLAAARRDRGGRQRQSARRAEVPRLHARRAGHAAGTPSSTRPTPSTRR